MFEAKCQLHTKESNPKAKHKSSIGSGDMKKLNEYLRKGLDEKNNWKEHENVLQSMLFYFNLFPLSFLAVEEDKDGAIFRQNSLPSKPMMLGEDT